MGSLPVARGNELVQDVFLDWSTWPAVLMRPPPRPLQDQQLHAFLDHFCRRIQAAGQPWGLVLDLRNAARMSATQRQMLTDTMQRNESALAELCFGSAMVFRSPLMRGMMTAMLWVFRPPYPLKVFNDVHSATRWIIGNVEQQRQRTA